MQLQQHNMCLVSRLRLQRVPGTHAICTGGRKVGLNVAPGRYRRPCAVVSENVYAGDVGNKGMDTLMLERLVQHKHNGKLNFQQAVWVEDIVPPPEARRTDSATDSDTDDAQSWEDLPQGYRCADHVAVYRVPARGVDQVTLSSMDGADALSMLMEAQPGSTTPASNKPLKSRLVVCKVSHFIDPETSEMDSYKQAAATNEWKTFTAHQQALDHRHVVQLLAASQSQSSVFLVSEFCDRGDLQNWVTRINADVAGGSASHAPVSLGAASIGQPCDAPPEEGATAAVQHSTVTDAGLRDMAQQGNGWLGGILRWLRSSALAHTMVAILQAVEVVLRRGTVLRSWHVTGGDGRAATCASSALAMTPRQLSQLPASTASSPAVAAPLWTSRLSGWLEPRASSTAKAQAQWRRLLLGRAAGGVRMTERQVAHVAVHLLQGLSALHSAGLTHGDVKPANIFIGKSKSRRLAALSSGAGRLDHAQCPPQPGADPLLTTHDMVFKIGDYGTMRESGREHLSYFVTGFGFSPEYAAPEVLQHGTSRAGRASDVWSVGITLLQLLLGRLPAVAVIMEKLREPSHTRERAALLTACPPADISARELREAGVLVSEPLLTVLTACLQVSPGQRPATASHLLHLDWFCTGVAHHVELSLQPSLAAAMAGVGGGASAQPLLPAGPPTGAVPMPVLVPA